MKEAQGANPQLILPFIFMGIDDSGPFGSDEVCERWIGPHGESVFYIHLADDPKWATTAGGNIIRRKTEDPGRAYMGLVDQGSDAARIAINSLPEQFPGARLHLMATVHGLSNDVAQKYIAKSDRTENESDEADWAFKSMSGDGFGLRVPIDVNFCQRFLAKVALGFGVSIIGDEFNKSPYAEGLRAILWPALGFNYGERVCGSNFWEDTDSRLKILGWSGGWVLQFSYNTDGMMLSIFMPNGKLLAIKVSDDINLMSAKNREIYEHGLAYLIIPARSTCIGPIEMPNYVAHKLGNIKIPELAALE